MKAIGFILLLILLLLFHCLHNHMPAPDGQNKLFYIWRLLTHSHFSHSKVFRLHNNMEWMLCALNSKKQRIDRYIINHIVLHVWWNTSICWTQIETSTFNWKWKKRLRWTFYNRIIYILGYFEELMWKVNNHWAEPNFYHIFHAIRKRNRIGAIVVEWYILLFIYKLKNSTRNAFKYRNCC